MEFRVCLLVVNHAYNSVELEEEIKKFFFIVIKKCYTNAEAIKVLATEKIDFVILCLSDKNDPILNLFKIVPQIPPTIMVCDSSEYAISAFDLDAVKDYIVSPFSEERFDRAISRCLQIKIGDRKIVEDTYVFLKISRKLMRFDYAEIDYISAFGAYSKIHLGENIIVVNEPMSSLGEIMPQRVFKRVHKSYIINISKVNSFDNKEFCINKAIIPIGISYKSQIEGLLKKLNESLI